MKRISIDEQPITETDVSDSEGMDRILPTDIPIDQVIADGAYYSIERAEAAERLSLLEFAYPARDWFSGARLIPFLAART